MVQDTKEDRTTQDSATPANLASPYSQDKPYKVDPVEYQTRVRNLLNEVERVKGSAYTLLSESDDVEDLNKAFDSVRGWLYDKLGLELDDEGNVKNNTNVTDTYLREPATGDEAEAEKKREQYLKDQEAGKASSESDKTESKKAEDTANSDSTSDNSK